MTALLTFESAARHGSISQAARELGISQPAASRQMASLEKQLDARLFERSPEGVSLTPAGAKFQEAVKAGLSLLQQATVEASTFQHDEQIVIACSHDSSSHFLLPRHHALQQELGEHTEIRIITFRQHIRQLPEYPPADVVLTWEASIDTDEYVVLHEERAGPVCSPQFELQHRESLKRPVSAWADLPFLALARPNLGWATWSDWFQKVGAPATAPRFKRFDSYDYVLNAAVHGEGIALGWLHYIEHHLETGALIPLADGFVEFGNRFCGMLTSRGRLKPTAQSCLSFLAGR